MPFNHRDHQTQSSSSSSQEKINKLSNSINEESPKIDHTYNQLLPKKMPYHDESSSKKTEK